MQTHRSPPKSPNDPIEREATNGRDEALKLASKRPGTSAVSLYRTRWLIAHNHLHAIVHDGGSAKEKWATYLVELCVAREVASRPG